MVRGMQHEAVYALTSGAGAVGGRSPPPPTPPSPPTVTVQTPDFETEVAEKRAAGAHAERVRRGSMKRAKVVPDPRYPKSESLAEPSITTATTAAADDASTVVAQHTQQQPAPPAPSSPALPVIQRGLRASRIVPVSDAETAAGVRSNQPPKEGHGVSPSALFVDDHRRVYPSEEHSDSESQGTGGGLDGGGDSAKGGPSQTRIPPRRPPALTNLDLSSSPTAVSSSSTLPPLELEVAPLPSLPPTPSSPASGRTAMARGRNDQKSGKPEDDIESNLGVARASGDEVASALKTNGSNAEEGRIYSAAEAAAAAGEKEAADLKGKISLGRRHAEELRHRLNHTFFPQGIEITAVMICSTELPAHIAEQMSGRTLNASLAKEQRAVKRSESQKVRHEGEVLELRQRWEIERSLVVREGAREAGQVRTLYGTALDNEINKRLRG